MASGDDVHGSTPAREVARAYLEAVEGTMHGEILQPADAADVRHSLLCAVNVPRCLL